jgi:hypothetical protein
MNHEHPDANLLAAFTENRLGGREREDLLAHLAGCADCRQIVALSTNPAAATAAAKRHAGDINLGFASVAGSELRATI